MVLNKDEIISRGDHVFIATPDMDARISLIDQNID